MNRFQAETAVETESRETGDKHLRPAPAIDAGRAYARRADEIDPGNEATPAVFFAEQYDFRDQEIEIGRAERARKAHAGLRRIADADEIDVGSAVDLAATKKEGVNTAFGGAV